jgi:excisionase family DNA binding protein
MGEWMTIDEAADYLRISKSDIRKYIRTGILHGYRQGISMNLMASEVDAFMLPHEPYD